MSGIVPSLSIVNASSADTQNVLFWYQVTTRITETVL